MEAQQINRPWTTRQTLLRWTLWLLVVVTACIGLRQYQIDHDLRRWMPHLAGRDDLAGMLIVGFDAQQQDRQALADQLHQLPASGMQFFFEGDGRLSGFFILPSQGMTGASLLSQVRELQRSRALSLYLAGPAVFAQAMDDWSQQGLNLASGLILLCGAAALYFTLGSAVKTVQSLLAVFGSQLILLGWIAWRGQPMDMLLSMLPPLMMAIGFSFAAHRMLRANVQLALILSMATTVASLLTFTWTDFPAIRSFALWGALGIVITWASVMWLLPPGVEDTTPASPLLKPWRPWKAWLLTAGGIGVVAVAALFCQDLQVESDVLRYFPRSARIVQDYQMLNDELTGMLPFEVHLDTASSHSKNLQAQAQAMLESTPGVRRIVPLPGEIAADHVTFFGLADNEALPSLAHVQAHWQRWAQKHHATIRWQGVAAQLDHIGRSVTRTAFLAVPCMIGIAGLAAGAINRRLLDVLLSMYVNAFPAAGLVLILRITHHPIGLSTLVIFSLAIGMAIDDTLHLLVASRKVGSIQRAVRTCFRPCLGSSVALASCVAMLGICPFKPTAEFGLLVCATTLLASAGDLLLLPAASQIMQPRTPGPQMTINPGP